MNKIINNKRYNTDTARNLGEWDNGLLGTDRNYYKETLYITKSGNYFIHGYGNLNTIYGERKNEQRCISEKIMPLICQEAKNWVAEKMNSEDIEVIFNEFDEEKDNSHKKIMLTLPFSILKSLKEKKETTGANISWLVTKALRKARY